MKDYRCMAYQCYRCALSFGDGYADVLAGTEIKTPLPPMLAPHEGPLPVVLFDKPKEPPAGLQERLEEMVTISEAQASSAPWGLPTGYDERKRMQIWTFLTEYFPDAFLAVVNVAVAGNDQHNAGEPLHWARGKSMDQMNTAARHMFDHSTVGAKDTDGCYHLAKAIWRLSAELQLLIEAEHKLKGEK